MSASHHRVATLSSCPPPDTVRGLRSFIGAYKALSRVLPNCSQLLAPLDQILSGKDTSLVHFHAAQNALKEHKSITLPRPSDQLWIVTDGSVAKSGIGATLYVNRDSKLQLASFFSAKLRKHQVTWLPCEIEALSIAASIKHFSPYIIQSVQPTCLLTDSIAKDGLLVVPRTDPLSPITELIVVPRSALDGLITALHVRLDHPTTHKLNLAMKRHFYALDMTKAIDRVRDTCHTCASLRNLPSDLLRSPPKYPHDLSAYESHPTTWRMNINNVNTCVSLYRVTVAEVWNSLTNLEKKTNRNCATHGVVLVISVERVTSAIATSARITSAYFRAYNIVHCYCPGITI